MGMTDTATRLIKRFGQAATLTKPGAPSGDPWNQTPGTPVDYPVIVAVTQFTIEERSALLIETSDLRVFMTAGTEPTTADTLTIGGVSYSVERVNILGPDGVVICFELQVRA
jgi:hypothetical protein